MQKMRKQEVQTSKQEVIKRVLINFKMARLKLKDLRERTEKFYRGYHNNSMDLFNIRTEQDYKLISESFKKWCGNQEISPEEKERVIEAKQRINSELAELALYG